MPPSGRRYSSLLNDLLPAGTPVLAPEFVLCSSHCDHLGAPHRMSTTPGAGRDRPGSSRAPPGEKLKKQAGAALDPTPHQRGCHPGRRSNPSAPRQGIKTASASRKIPELQPLPPNLRTAIPPKRNVDVGQQPHSRPQPVGLLGAARSHSSLESARPSRARERVANSAN